MQLLVTKFLELDVLNLCFKIEVGSGLISGNGCSQPTCQTGPVRRKPAAATVQDVSLTVKVVKTCILLVIDVGGRNHYTTSMRSETKG